MPDPDWLIQARAKGLALNEGKPRRISPEHRAMSIRKPKDTPLGKYRIEVKQWWPATTNKLVGWHWAVAAKFKKRDRDLIAAVSLDIPKASRKRRLTLQIAGMSMMKPCA